MNKNTQRLNELTEEMEMLIGRLADDKSPQAEDLRERVRDTVQSAKGVLEERSARTVESVKQALTTADYFIRDYPWAAIAITAAVIGTAGILIGLGAAPRRRI
jgi:ElaB/YqjD/DUF883 family membrane-anchored ribosome-binding protein